MSMTKSAARPSIASSKRTPAGYDENARFCFWVSS
jgi:hypothetical protein